jgi:hypothetical protein
MPNKAKLVTRSASTTSVVADTIPKSDTLTHIELDSNLLNLRDATFGIAGDDSATIDVGMGNTLKIAGGNNISTAATGQTITITGSKIIDVNEINSGDSSAIQINDGVNISGTLNAKTIVTNDIFSGDSTAVQILDGLGVGGNLGVTGSISSPTHIQMGSGSATTLAAGRMWYNESDGTWNLGMGGGNITQQVGEELFRYGKASSAITDSPLQLIYKTGTVGASGVITFAPAIAGITDSDQILGCATENIALNSFGRITSYGVIHNITTDGSAYGETWADNNDIYYNPTTGGLTKTIPTSGLKMLIGTVINASAGGAGSFVVKLGVATYLSRLSDVTLSSLTANDTLRYNGTAWVNTPSKIIDVNEISSSDSTAIQVNDSLNVSGTLTANTFSTTNISSTSPNGAITITPNGTGDVVLSADTVQIGDANANATITTNGTGDLILNTNSGTNSGTITIFDAANGNIVVEPNGTGKAIMGPALTSTNFPYTIYNTSNAIPQYDSVSYRGNQMVYSNLSVADITTFDGRHLANTRTVYAKADSSATTYNNTQFRINNQDQTIFDLNGATFGSTATNSRATAIRGTNSNAILTNSGGGTKTGPNLTGANSFVQVDENHGGTLTVVNAHGVRSNMTVRGNSTDTTTITNGYTFLADTNAGGGGAGSAAGTNYKITNAYAFADIPSTTTNLETTHYGFYQASGSNAGTTYGVYISNQAYESQVGTLTYLIGKRNQLTYSANITVNCDLAVYHTVTLTGNTDFVITNMDTGQSIVLIITQDATGNKTATFSTSTSGAVKFVGGSKTLSTAGGSIDTVTIFNDGLNYLARLDKAYA